MNPRRKARDRFKQEQFDEMGGKAAKEYQARL